MSNSNMLDWGQIFNFEMIVASISGIVVTSVYMNPGEYSIGVSVLRFDPYFAIMFAFCFVALWSVVDILKSDDNDNDDT